MVFSVVKLSLKQPFFQVFLTGLSGFPLCYRVAAHPGASATAAFTTIARRVTSRDAAAAGRRRRQQTSATPGSKLRVN